MAGHRHQHHEIGQTGVALVGAGADIGLERLAGDFDKFDAAGKVADIGLVGIGLKEAVMPLLVFAVERTRTQAIAF
ncbi:MAG: hypothetical protein ACOY3E_17115 [Pseudomonadota bacterium]